MDLFCVTSTDNDIEYPGALILSKALKSNTALTRLDLSCEDKRNNTHMMFINKLTLFYCHQINRQ